MMEARFAKACEEGLLPGVVLLAKSKSGLFEYKQAFGKCSVKDDAKPLEPTTLLRIASATKLIVSVCAMQCVERGLVSLDDDVQKFVPELEGVKLLIGFDDHGEPVLVDPRNKITFRNLLSHTSGFAYDVLSPLIVKWREWQGQSTQPLGPRLVDRYSYPLDAEPSARWIYSPSLDWVGRAIEHLTGTNLEQYVQINVCAPLRLNKLTFFPQTHPELLVGHADISRRKEGIDLLEHVDQPYWSKDPEEALGGSGVFTTAQDFFTILESLLMDDRRLVSSESRKELLSPQLTKEARVGLAETMKDNAWYEDWNMGGAFPVGSDRDHSLCGMYLREEVPQEISPRRPGSVAWSGLPNFYWLIDPEAGICTLYASQVEPTWDVHSKELLRLFEQTVYSRMYQAQEGT